MTAWCQNAVSKSGTLLLSQEGCSLEDGSQDSLFSHDGVPDLSWQHGGSMLSYQEHLSSLQCMDAVGSVKGRAFSV